MELIMTFPSQWLPLSLNSNSITWSTRPSVLWFCDSSLQGLSHVFTWATLHLLLDSFHLACLLIALISESLILYTGAPCLVAFLKGLPWKLLSLSPPWTVSLPLGGFCPLLRYRHTCLGVACALCAAVCPSPYSPASLYLQDVFPTPPTVVCVAFCLIGWFLVTLYFVKAWTVF